MSVWPPKGGDVASALSLLLSLGVREGLWATGVHLLLEDFDLWREDAG